MIAPHGVLVLPLVCTVVQAVAGTEKHGNVLPRGNHGTGDGNGDHLPRRSSQVRGAILGKSDITGRGHGWGDEA